MRGFALALSCLLLAGCADSVDNQVLINANRNHIAAEVTVSGTVTTLLPDSPGSDGSHQRFDVDVSGLSVEIDHNISLAPRAPVKVGDLLTIHGQFEPDPGHPVIHYTHHAVSKHAGGYIELNGTTYE